MAIDSTDATEHDFLDLRSEVSEVHARGSRVRPQPAAHLRIHKILVPVDFSECSDRALDYAVGLAQPFGAGIALLHVVEPGIGTNQSLALTPTLDAAHQRSLNAAQERLACLRERHLAAFTSAETLVRIGRSPSEIVDTAKALGADLIVLGTHGSTGSRISLLGGTAEKVVRQANCPVLTVRCWQH